MGLGTGHAVPADGARREPARHRTVLLTALAVPVGSVAVTMTVYTVLARAGALPWQIGLVTVAVGLVVFVGGLVLLARVAGAVTDRRNAGFREGAAQWARARHWRVHEGDLWGRQPYPEHLHSPNLEARECDQLIEGHVHGRPVRIESWDVHYRPTGAARTVRRRQQLMRITASANLPVFMLLTHLPQRPMLALPRSMVRTAVTPSGPGAATIDPHGVGEWLRQPVLTYRESARTLGANAIVTPGEVTLVFSSDAEPEVLARRVELAVHVAHTAEVAAQGASGSAA